MPPVATLQRRRCQPGAGSDCWSCAGIWSWPPCWWWSRCCRRECPEHHRARRGHTCLRRGVEEVEADQANHTEQGIDMTAITASRGASTRAAAYWIATGLLAAELIVGGIWDILRIPLARDVVTDLGYPTYLMAILGTWKLLGAAAILVPGYPVLKEWAYAGAFFVFSGAIVSHLTTGKALQELGVLAVALVLVVASWALRSPNRRVSGTAERSVSGP